MKRECFSALAVTLLLIVLDVVFGLSLRAPHSALRAAVNEGSWETVVIKDVPHVKQKPDFCGEACAEMWLRKLGKNADQDYVFDQCGVDPVLARGAWTPELAAGLRKIGFQIGDVWHKIDPGKPEQPAAAGGAEAEWRALLADLRKGVPSIVCMHADDSPRTTEHFRLILGFDGKSDEVVYHEPAFDDGAYKRMSREKFLKLWPLKSGEKAWTAIRLRLEPGDIKIGPRPDGHTPAEFCQHIMELKKKVPAGESFTLVLSPPFVVLGDEPASIVRERARSTVQWSVEKLKALYFKKDPDEIIDVWLFKDKGSYEKHAKGLFSDTPTTPYGYYSETHRALIMNIATGGGTLVHEIVHPFVRANFPECPSWFNEGLGSLYEQSEEKDGRIHGRTNWRLAGLQEAIQKGKVPTFEALTGTSSDEFYNKDRGTNYAQARYLCYYLQEKCLLAKFYQDFAAARKEDPTGYKTLVKVLGEKDMKAFQERWQEYVLKLRFP